MIATGGSLIQRSIDRAIGQLPALPDAVLQVVEETNRPEPSAARVETLVASDQALTSKTLKVVNSAYYGLPGQVSGVSQAIVILGLQQVRNLVLSVGTMTLFQNQGRTGQEALRQFWLHAFTTAAVCQGIASRAKLDPATSEQMFVGGLLHDLGRLFMFSSLPSVYEQVLKKVEVQGVPLEIVEREVLGMDHGQVGALLCRSWRLPETLIQMVERHEGPFGETDPTSVLAVHLADSVVKQWSSEPNAVHSPPSPVALARLGVDEAGIEALTELASLKLEEASSLYGAIAA